MLVGLCESCDTQKLQKVIAISRLMFGKFYGLTAEDKEDILVDVMYRFEADKAKFPVSVYGRHCHNKIVGFLGKKTAQKRMQSKVVDGKRIYIEDLSLHQKLKEDSDTELQDTIAVEDPALAEIEFMSEVESIFPDIADIVRGILHGRDLTRWEKNRLKEYFDKEDLMEGYLV